MNRTNQNIIWGTLLVLAGIIFLLQTLNIVETASGLVWGLIWSALFAVAGLAFLFTFFAGQDTGWWAAIPGFTLLALSALVGLAALDLAGDYWMGALFLSGPAIGFLSVYLARRDFWWAIIPAGALFTLALVVIVSDAYGGEISGSTLFLGLAVTFVALYFVPSTPGRKTWTLVPAAILALMGVATLAAFTELLGYVWALALIALGLYMLFRPRGEHQPDTRHR